MVEVKKSLELKKHVATIHSTNKLSLLQRKISNALLYNAYDELLNKDEHQIHIGALCQLIGYNSNDHKIIKKALIELLSTVLEWNLVDGEKLDKADAGIWNASAIIADASIDGAICTYSYSNKMKQLLYRPELYGRLNMAVQAQFQSSYGLALYENCIRYQDIGRTPVFTLRQFRKLMGIEENTYKVFRDLKHRVLDKAMAEVNDYSPIILSVELQKAARQVISIQFMIKPKNQLQTAAMPTTFAEQLKQQFGLAKNQINEIITLHSETYIQEKMAMVMNSSSYKQGKIKNLAKYLLSALKDDYQTPKSADLKTDTALSEDYYRQLQEIHRQYHAYREAFVDESIAALTPLAKQQLHEDFFKVSKHNIQTMLRLQRHKYNEQTILQSAPIKALLRQYALQVLPELAKNLVSIETFIKRLAEPYQKAYAYCQAAGLDCNVK